MLFHYYRGYYRTVAIVASSADVSQALPHDFAWRLIWRASSETQNRGE